MEALPLPAVDLSGRFEYEPGARPTQFDFKVTLRDGIGHIFNASPDQEGAFSFQGLFPGNYQVEVWPVYPPSPGPSILAVTPYPKAIFFGKNPVTAHGIDLEGPVSNSLRIDVSAARARLDGVVVDSAGNPVAGALVWVSTPISWHRRYSANVTSDAAGAFHFQFLPTGEFRIFAFLATDHTYVLDADYLGRHEDRSVAVTLKPGVNSATVVLPF